MCKSNMPKMPEQKVVAPPAPPDEKLQVAPVLAGDTSAKPKGMKALRKDLTIPLGPFQAGRSSGLNIPT